MFQLIQLVTFKFSHKDRLFTNILKTDKWLTKQDLESINQNNYLECLQDSSILSVPEITKLVNFCVDLSFENNSNIFSVVLINDIEDLSDSSYMDELKLVANKFKDTKVNLLKSFTINTIILDKLQLSSNQSNLYFLNDLTMLSMGHIFCPKVPIIIYELELRWTGEKFDNFVEHVWPSSVTQFESSCQRQQRPSNSEY